MRSAFILAVLACVGTSLMSGCVGGTGSPSSISVAITPITANVAVNTSQQFTATVTGTSNTAVTWSVVGGSANGTITESGMYIAPAIVPTPAQVTVTAASRLNTSKTASATVTVTSATAQPLVVSPATASVPSFGTQQFNATMNGAPTSAVTWNVNGVAGGNQQFGSISSSGLYTAPGGVPTSANGTGDSVTTTVAVSAVSQTAGALSASATVSIVPANQTAESGAIKLGVSGGNENDSSTSGNTITCCSGTLGALLADSAGKQYILSNTHVIARSDIAQPGDPIIQPGLVDTTPACNATTARKVAQLSAFYNLESGATPKVDAAIAQVLPGAVDPNGSILYLGSTTDSNGAPTPGQLHAGTAVPLVTPAVGMTVAKSGRATGLTCSTVLSVITTVTGVQYQKGCGTGPTFKVSFANQVVVSGGNFSAEGDSGSLIVTQSAADPVALLYGGSDSDTVGNPVADVLSFFASNGNAVGFIGDPNRSAPVIGCSLRSQKASVAATVAASASPQSLEQAAAARDAHAAELFVHPEVQAVGVGPSYDNPREAAIVLFMTKGQSRRTVPAEIDGIRTRIVERNAFAARGMLSHEESNQLEALAPSADQAYSISRDELQRARSAQVAHQAELMKQPGVQGVGISSSLDAPGQAALMIFLVRGDPHNPVPAVVDGVRTRLRVSSPFKAGTRGRQRPQACPASLAPKK